MVERLPRGAVILLVAALSGGAARGQESEVANAGQAVRPADEIFWAPTLEQARAMAQANRIPIFLMGYSLVGDRSTYTKLGPDCASTVF